MSDFVGLDVTESVATITLTRPELHNAFNEDMLQAFDSFLDVVTNDQSVRVLLIAAEGKSFSAGADLEWLQSQVDMDVEGARAESERLFDILAKLRGLPIPTIARAQGDAIGGGAGLVAAADIAIACEDAHFAFSEVRLGMAPAVIAPILIGRMGSNRCRHLFLTGERFSAHAAARYGLIDVVTTADELDGAVEKTVERLLAGGRLAQARIKELTTTIPGKSTDELRSYTACLAAELRCSEGGRKRLKGFLRKMTAKLGRDGGRSKD